MNSCGVITLRHVCASEVKEFCPCLHDLAQYSLQDFSFCKPLHYLATNILQRGGIRIFCQVLLGLQGNPARTVARTLQDIPQLLKFLTKVLQDYNKL